MKPKVRIANATPSPRTISAWLKELWKCGTCDGSGISEYTQPHGCDDPNCGKDPKAICPTCDGRGWTPPDEAIEAIEGAKFEVFVASDGYNAIRHRELTGEVVLVAFVEWMNQ